MEGSKILVVEDERVMAEDINERPRKCGYQIPVVVSSGKDAVER